MIRVLVAEDSAAVRLLLVSILSTDPTIEVVGEAASGEETIRLTERLRPDVITMDIHMPGMDGIEATKIIMSRYPTPIVIVSSSVRNKDVEMSLQATSVGALTAIPKPSDPQSPTYQDRVEQFVDTVKAMSQVKVVRRWGERSTPAIAIRDARSEAVWTPMDRNASGNTQLHQQSASTVQPTAQPTAQQRIDVVAMAASTGGPAALQHVLQTLPSSFPVPILIVQHIAEGFLNALVHWLQGSCALQIVVAQEDEALVPGTVYFAPHTRHLGINSLHRISLSSRAAIDGFRPSATHLFTSVAQAYGANALGIIMTGMGRDGIEGLKRLHEAGGWIVAQNEASSVVFGMPQEAIRAGVVNEVVPLTAIAEAMIDKTSFV